MTAEFTLHYFYKFFHKSLLLTLYIKKLGNIASRNTESVHESLCDTYTFLATYTKEMKLACQEDTCLLG